MFRYIPSFCSVIVRILLINFGGEFWKKDLKALFYSYKSYFMKFFVRPIISTLGFYAKMRGGWVKGKGRGPKFVNPEIAILVETMTTLGQVDFLNSVIVDMQRKNDDLKAKLDLLENAGVLGGARR